MTLKLLYHMLEVPHPWKSVSFQNGKVSWHPLKVTSAWIYARPVREWNLRRTGKASTEQESALLSKLKGRLSEHNAWPEGNAHFSLECAKYTGIKIFNVKKDISAIGGKHQAENKKPTSPQAIYGFMWNLYCHFSSDVNQKCTLHFLWITCVIPLLPKILHRYPSSVNAKRSRA